MSAGIPTTAGTRLEYDKRINRVIDHIRGHLADDLSVARLAQVAWFSPFHFHRLFRAVTGETVFGFIHRLRLERAAAALRDHPDRSVLAIALDHGFASAAGFARAFRGRFGMTATRWRAGGWRRRRKPGKQVRKPRKAATAGSRHAAAMSIRVRQAPGYRVACMRYVGPYGAHGIPELWARLRRWMAGRELGSPRLTLGVAHDDPTITVPERCRYDAGVVVPVGFTPDRLVDVIVIAGGTYAVAEFTGTAHDIVGAWDRLFAGWLPGSGYEPDDRPCYELYRGDPTVDARRRVFRCELHLPVRPL